MSETIRRFVFPACSRGEHEQCPSYQSGYVDGKLRTAGEQCSCEHHVMPACDCDAERLNAPYHSEECAQRKWRRKQ